MIPDSGLFLGHPVYGVEWSDASKHIRLVFDMTFREKK